MLPLVKGLAQYSWILWDVLEQSPLFSAAVIEGLVVSTVHIHKMLELSVLPVSNSIYSLFVLILTLPFLYPKAMK